MSILPDWYRHSASSGNRFREAPDSFLWRYALGNKETVNSKMATGGAVEAGLAAHLLGDTIEGGVASALIAYDASTAGEVGPERDDIAALMQQAADALKPFGPFLTYQSILRLDAGVHHGLRYPVIAYTDFGYQDFTLDTKITWRLPSKPDFSHVCQLAVYSKLQGGKPQKVAYITPKKHAVYDVPAEDLAHGWRVMLATWRRIEALDARCRTPDEALALVPLNPDNFRWNQTDMSKVLATWNV